MRLLIALAATLGLASGALAGEVAPGDVAIVDGSIYLIGEGPAPATPPAHLPEVMQQNLGAVTIRKTLLDD